MSLDEFRHQPLRDKMSIRILELLPSLRGSPLRCRVMEKPLRSCGTFEALSYVWGDPELVERVQIGKHFIRITRNCSVALCGLREPNRPRKIWVDSICIDQNAPQERNHQVGMMSTIYSKAQRVIVWLGYQQVEADDALKFIRNLSRTTRVSKVEYQRKLSCLKALFESSWFSRAWPVQEVAFSHECKIMNAMHSISADQLMRFLTLVKDYTMRDHSLHRAQVHRQMWSYIQHARVHSRFHSRSLSAQRKPKLKSCTEMLLKTRHLTATDPRDKIFAVHGLLSVLGAHLPDPDYSKSIVQVYREAASAAIRHDNRLNILASITGRTLIDELPSWVPDWSCSLPITQVASWEDHDYAVMSETRPGRNGYVLNTRPKFRISADGSFLTLWGLCVDTIHERSEDVFPHHYLQYQIREVRVLKRWFQRLERSLGQKGLMEFFSGLIEKPWARTNTSFDLSVLVLSEYWIKGVRCFNSCPIGLPGSQYTAEDICFWAAKCAKKDGRKNIGDRVKEDMWYFHHLMRTLLDRKVTFRTNKGHWGIASEALQDNDQIVYFHAVSLPMIVRKVGSNWRLVAPAYIQDGMIEHKTGAAQNKVLTSLGPDRRWIEYVLA